MAEETEAAIRNFGQTHQERPIIKLAPDTIVYIDGLPYLINDYVGRGGVLFNFNDYVTQASGAADLNTWVPSCTVNISLPNDLRYLVQAPAGQRIIKSMSEIKIFTKGYYLTDSGDSVYHRVFWGVISSIAYSDNKKTLEITLACKGILHLFELMQINLAPSAMTAQHTGAEVTATIDRWPELNPFEIVLHAFKHPLGLENIDVETVAENNARPPANLFERVYARKWNAHLLRMRKSVRLYGLSASGSSKKGPGAVQDSLDTHTADPEGRTPSESTSSRQGATKATVDEVKRNSVIDHDLVAKFLPSFKIGAINLLQSTVTSRLTRIDEMVRVMGWEGYQDLDGSIVIKPPLYNLDTQNTKAPATRNPFIIHLPEVVNSEAETEDEGQVRLTRISVQGSMDRTPLIGDGAASNILPTTSYFDPGLVRQFGLRQEPVKVMPVIANNSYALFAFAAAEMTKINKNYRTYSVTIPMRPELHLGFPLYVPHLDIYAYLENISWSYVRGSQATMTLTCNHVRNRELFAKETPVKEGEVITKEWVYTSVPNLILAYTAAPAAEASVNSKNQVVTSPVGSAGTLPPEDSKKHDPTPAQKELLAREERFRMFIGTEPDAKGISWRVSEDAAGFFIKEGTGGVVNEDYYKKITKGLMPYTDAKGYTLERPFPWGRYKTLEDVLDVMTRPQERRTGKLLPFEAADSQEAKDQKGAAKASTSGVKITGSAGVSDAFIMSGLGTPSVSTVDPTKGTPADQQVFDKLLALKSMINDDVTCFILAFDETTGDRADTNVYNDTETSGNNTAIVDRGAPLPASDTGEAQAQAMVNGVAQGEIAGETELSQ